MSSRRCGRAGKLLEPMDFRFCYDPYDAGDPITHPGQLRVGYRPDEHVYYGHYGMLNTEARIVSYLGIARGQLPPEHYYRLFRTLPENLGPQEQTPRGTTRTYRGVEVFEGSYEYRGARIVPSWGGSMFEALMVTPFVPEDLWAPRSWGLNHPLYVRAQIAHGMEEAGYGYWGFSPAASPRGGYEVYGVKALGAYLPGYFSSEIGPPVPPSLMPHSTRSAHGVVTPHAAFLALRYAPGEVMANLGALEAGLPMYGPPGFEDSVDVSVGVTSGRILASDQGMIMAAIANELADDAMRHAFSDGPLGLRSYCTRKFNRCPRALLWFVGNPNRFVFNPDAVRRKSDPQATYDDKRANPAGKLLDDVGIDIPRRAGTHRERRPAFPTRLPVRLLRRIVGCASNPDDLVLDPSAGSGTGGQAAVEAGRRDVGIEKGERFAARAGMRLEGLGGAAGR